MDWLATALNLTPGEVFALAAITFVAGVVRGFSGFALSAMVMAMAVLILPPVELIAMCWWLEMTASVLMMKGGWADADRGVAVGPDCRVGIRRAVRAVADDIRFARNVEDYRALRPAVPCGVAAGKGAADRSSPRAPVCTARALPPGS